ncbi:hypothetical protein F5887DRAFT_1068806 [Amanita rubescens]|nr:hypothetical protein F5887DRAFT_1068806 [Amanita rubescens]
MKVDPPLDPAPQLPLTSAQISRATTRAIHHCLQLHSIGDAYYVLNCLRYSNFRHQKSLFKFRGIRSVDHFEDAAMRFEFPVSPRLSSHALLHGLLRIGLQKKAYRLAGLMIKDGINVRSRTLQAVMQTFYPPTPARFHPARLIDIEFSSAHPIGVKPVKPRPAHPIDVEPVLRVRMAQDEGTRMAISLWMLAQKSWHKRTRSMYKTLLALCILNGEIILGSLLFGYMIRHWQMHVAENPGAIQPMPSPATGNTNIKRRPKQFMRINANLKHDEGSVQAALQALAIIANILDQKGLPITNLSLLLRTLYKIPKIDHLVWVTENGERTQKKAYDYFRHVLRRLIINLRSKTAIKYRPGQYLTPALDLPSYNALLHYSLCQPPPLNLGNAVLNHMVNERRPGLKPDIVTFNIMISSGTKTRDFHMVEKALSVLRRNPKNHLLASVVANEVTHDHSASPNRTAKPAVQDQDATWVEEIPACHIPEMDSRTLCSYIEYLVVAGRPDKAAALFALLVPELQKCRRYLPQYQRRELREAHIRKAVMLGPRVFTSILKALYKAGKCGVAERVWLVALAAEAASRNPKFECWGWSLPVHAYTVMIQCYGTQIRKPGRVIGWGRLDGKAVMSQRRSAAYRLAGKTYELAKSKFHEKALDVRFFEAALKVFSRAVREDGRMAVRRRHLRCFYKRRLRKALRAYARFGIPGPSNFRIIQVAQDALSAGYAIPASYHHMLLGHISRSELAMHARPFRRFSQRSPSRGKRT